MFDWMTVSLLLAKHLYSVKSEFSTGLISSSDNQVPESTFIEQGWFLVHITRFQSQPLKYRANFSPDNQVPSQPLKYRVNFSPDNQVPKSTFKVQGWF